MFINGKQSLFSENYYCPPVFGSAQNGVDIVDIITAGRSTGCWNRTQKHPYMCVCKHSSNYIIPFRVFGAEATMNRLSKVAFGMGGILFPASFGAR
jgi:hypothetical protein